MSGDIVQDAIREHAASEYPRECCGVVIVVAGKRRYVPCRNLADQGHFRIHPDDYARAEDAGEIVEIVHSHPAMPPTPSDADLIGCESSGLPWVIVGWPSDRWERIEPNGYEAPYVGRSFALGVLDCYTLIRDYYHRELGIELHDYVRTEDDYECGRNLYLERFDEQGFVRVDTAQEHDVIIMEMGAPGHAGIFLAGGLILHHPRGHLSYRTVYGGQWRKHTVAVVRHRSRC